jgi:hypothetical protein
MSWQLMSLLKENFHLIKNRRAQTFLANSLRCLADHPVRAVVARANTAAESSCTFKQEMAFALCLA